MKIRRCPGSQVSCVENTKRTAGHRTGDVVTCKKRNCHLYGEDAERFVSSLSEASSELASELELSLSMSFRWAV